jgi:hypothetical protein
VLISTARGFDLSLWLCVAKPIHEGESRQFGASEYEAAYDSHHELQPAARMAWSHCDGVAPKGKAACAQGELRAYLMATSPHKARALAAAHPVLTRHLLISLDSKGLILGSATRARFER